MNFSLVLIFAATFMVGEQSEGADAVPVPVGYVVMETDQGTVEGFVFPSDPKSENLILVTAAGKFIEIPRDRVTKATPRAEHSFEEVPLQALVFGLGHADGRVRGHCQKLLRPKAGQAAELFRNTLKSEQSEPVRRTLEILTATPVPTLAAAVHKCLRHPAEVVRARAVDAYCRTRSDLAVSTAEEILERDPSEWVRQRALVALGHSGSMDAVDVVLEKLEELSETNRIAAFRTLRQVTGKTFGDTERHWRTWWRIEQGKVLPFGETPER